MFTQESTKRGSQMGRVSTVGEMAKFMLVNSSKEWNMEKGNGEVGKGLSVINMKETIWMIRNMDLESSNGPVVIVTKVNTKMMREMDMERWNGQMGVSIRETGSEGFSMVMEKCCFLMEK